MGKIILSNKLMHYIAKAEEIIEKMAFKQLIRERRIKKIPQIKVKDCVEEVDRIIFVVEKGQLGLVLGRRANNLEVLKKEFKKDIKIIEYDRDPAKFVENIFKPYKVEGISIDHQSSGKIIAQVSASPEEKGKIIGKSGRNIRSANLIAPRHTEVSEVRVV
jgi:N utilization substance protein A